MSRISHFETQPKNIHFWDYLILCKMNPEAALVLQHMEYWDSTKADDPVGTAPGHSTSGVGESYQASLCERWVYKSAEELHWELMGFLGEKQVQRVLTFLVDDLHYLARRTNPYHGFDRTKQYALQVTRLQRHLDVLAALIGAFHLPLSRLRPVFYAIECLTREGVSIEIVTVDLVIARLQAFKTDDHLPFFLKVAMRKFWQTMGWPDDRPYGTSAAWMTHGSLMDTAYVPNGLVSTADSITHACVSNTREDNRKDDAENTAKEDANEETDDADEVVPPTRSGIGAVRKQVEKTLLHIRHRTGTLPVPANAPQVAKAVASRNARIATPHTGVQVSTSSGHAGKTASIGRASGEHEARSRSKVPDIDAGTQAVIDAWNSLHQKPAPMTDDLVRAARLLVPCRLSKDDLQQIERFCFQSNPEWFRSRGVKLQNIATHLEKWQSWQAHQQALGDAPTARSDAPAGTVSGKKRLDGPIP